MSDMLGPYLLGPNDENQGIYTGDALELMSELPNQCIDALITDPPYCAGAISEAQRTRAKGQGLRSDTIRRFGWFVGDNMGTDGLCWLLRQMSVTAARVVCPTGSELVFCDWRMLAAIKPAVESSGLRYQNLIVWNKGSFGLGTGFRHQHELIMHFTFGSPEYHDRSVGNVITTQRVSSSDRIHQTQKPIALLSQLIRVIVPFSGIVLDPFLGSGTTAMAAKLMGCRWLAFEIDPDTADLARQRVREIQPPLFVPQPEQPELVLQGDTK